MYHIKEDKRAYKSAELIYQGLIECMRDKEFDKVSITDVQRISSVGRATFYRNFDTMIDVLYWKCDLKYKEVMETYVNMKTHDSNENEFLVFFFNYWMEHYEILDTLIYIGRYDIISQCHYNNAPILYNYFKDKYSLPNSNFRYYMAIRIGAFVGILISWVKCGRKENAEELVAILKSDISISVNQTLFI